MFSWFKDLLRALFEIRDALGGVCQAVHGLRTEPTEDAGLAARVATLELELERRHAEAEGLLLKAGGKLNAARAAEERERRLAESHERRENGDEDLELEELVRAYEEAGIPLGDDPGGGGEEMQPMPSSMDRRRASKSNAYAMKWSRGGNR